ncbi:MAG: transposase [Patescibacteria group bacterium]
MPNDRFRDRYRISSPRLLGWNYAKSGWYFVTICTKNRNHYFGDIVTMPDGIAGMELGLAGDIALREIMALKTRRPNINVDTFVVMPNHVHLLIQLGKQNNSALGVIIGQLKAGITRWVTDAGMTDFAWQERFHEKILRYGLGVDEVRAYIRNNPKQWLKDRNNPLGIYM